MSVQLEKIKNTRNKLTATIDEFLRKTDTQWDIDEIIELRGYKNTPIEDKMRKVFKEVGLFKMPSRDILEIMLPKVKEEELIEWGVYTKESKHHLLEDRYVIPIRDLEGKITALVGWFNDYKKYITTPTPGFSKKVQFFNEEIMETSIDKGYVILVEGIFDTLALRAIGEPVMGCMGADLSPIHIEKLKRYNKIIAIPDNDKRGNQSNPYKTGHNKYTWRIENKKVFVGLPEGIKDVDDLLKNFEGVEKVIEEVSKLDNFIQL